MKYCFLGKDVV